MIGYFPRYGQIPFNTDNWSYIKGPPDTESFPLQTGFCYNQVQFETSFKVSIF
jgi:hypothetical protein